MKYELAKQLKKRGFPQLGVVQTKFRDTETSEEICDPTLDELIEGCGKTYKRHLETLMFDDNEQLKYGSKQQEQICNFELVFDGQNNKWCAGYTWNNLWALDGGEHLVAFGKTPDQAVANLWLTLHQPSNP